VTKAGPQKERANDRIMTGIRTNKDNEIGIPQKDRVNGRIMTGIRTKQGQIKRQALKKTELMAEYIMGRDKDRTRTEKKTFRKETG
jgi:hypothetical protein